jgi:hypothetical protein
MLLASAPGEADDEPVLCAKVIGDREINPSRKRNVNKQRGNERISIS